MEKRTEKPIYSVKRKCLNIIRACGMKEQTLKEKLAKKPEDVIYLAVKGMLPKGPLGRQMIKKLHVYAGAEHNHAAQQPKALEIKY